MSEKDNRIAPAPSVAEHEPAKASEPEPLKAENGAHAENGDHAGVEPSESHPPTRKPITLAGRFIVFLSVLAPALVFVMLFSVMGMGDVVYLWLVDYYSYCYLAVGVGVGILVSLWTLDAPYWTGWKAGVLHFTLGAALVWIAFGCMLAAKAYPYAPLLFSLLGIAGSVYMVRQYVLKTVRSGDFFQALSLSLIVCSVAIATVFILWMFAIPPPSSRYEDIDGYPNSGWQDDWLNVWGGECKTYWRRRMQCEEASGSGDDDPTEEQEDCYLGAMLWWSYPLWIQLPICTFAILAGFLARVTSGNVSHKKGTRIAVKLFTCTIIVTCSSLYVAASIAGAGLAVTRVVEMGVLLFVLVMFVLVGETLGWRAITRSSKETNMYKKMTALSHDEFWVDMGKAFLVFALWPALLIFLPLDFLRQRCRECFGFVDHVGGKHFTKVTTERLKIMQRWHWGSILSKVTVWSLAYLVMNVLVMQAVVVFFAWVNELLQPLAPALVCVIFFGIGVAMFCIPVVPGVPVYLTAGVLIPYSVMTNADPDALDKEDVPVEFWYGLALACGVVFLVKLTAVAMEQELIGRFLGNKVSVRKIIRPNSLEMRAIKKLLSQPGLSVAKCTILVGGPDWPTSVITGILGLSCIQMLIGTIPILLLVIPSTAAGGFQLLLDKSDMYKSLATLVTMIAMVLQLAALIGAMVIIDNATSKYKEELEDPEKFPIDKEVEEIDKLDARRTAAWRASTHWSNVKGLPLWPKLVVGTAAAILTLAAWTAGLASSRCFVADFSVADSIHGEPLHGNPLNVILAPVGWMVIGAFVGGWCLRLVYLHWAGRRAESWMDSRELSSPVTA